MRNGMCCLAFRAHAGDRPVLVEPAYSLPLVVVPNNGYYRAVARINCIHRYVYLLYMPLIQARRTKSSTSSCSDCLPPRCSAIATRHTKKYVLKRLGRNTRESVTLQHRLVASLLALIRKVVIIERAGFTLRLF